MCFASRVCSEASNCNSAPYTVLRMWAQRRALLRQGLCSHDDDTDNIEWCSDVLAGQELLERSVTSPLLAEVRSSVLFTAVRFMSLLRQPPCEIMNNDWVLLTCDGTSCVARVAQMACIVQADGRARNCLWCVDCSTLPQGPTERDDGSIWIRKRDLGGAALAWCDEVSVTVLSMHEREDHYQYGYVW
jgi:hypothetical protein